MSQGGGSPPVQGRPVTGRLIGAAILAFIHATAVAVQLLIVSLVSKAFGVPWSNADLTPVSVMGVVLAATIVFGGVLALGGRPTLLLGSLLAWFAMAGAAVLTFGVPSLALVFLLGPVPALALLLIVLDRRAERSPPGPANAPA